MNKHSINYIPFEVRAEACSWLAQLESGELKPADVDAFREWLQRSPRHVAEIRQAAQLSADLNILTSLQEPVQDALAHYQTVLERPEARLSRPRWAVAATFAIFALFIGLKAIFSVPEPHMWPTVVTTAVGEYQKVELEDGSYIEVNTNSQLRISYSTNDRVIHLLRGEALFSVAKDKSRPFIVYTQGRYVRAVGTAFVVRQDQSRFELTVTEGEVQLGRSPADGSAPVVSLPSAREQAGSTSSAQAVRRSPSSPSVHTAQPLAIKAGQRYIATTADDTFAAALTQTIDKRELARELAWQDGLLEFSNTPLADVVREVSRYTELSIDIVDPQLRTLAFGGLFRTGDTPALFEALESAYGIQATYIDKKSVTLSQPTPN